MSASAPRPRIDGPDLDLLRAFEPIVRYTAGESFLPMSVETYVAVASKLRSRNEDDELLAERGSIAADSLADDLEKGGQERDYLTVAGIREESVAAIFRAEARQAVGFRHLGGRLARVGYLSRLVDALFSMSLLARGRVPGSLARRAVAEYRTLAGVGSTHPYYGRVVRTGTWTALQYWFFYAFNDWRSGFNGANDHEADWEQIILYVDADADGRAIPCWAAYAQHDYHGRDLRRRWDDAPELELMGDHPVVYAGAGSHASYFRRGEYLAEQELRMPGPIRGAVNAFLRVLSGSRSSERMLSIPFVDYARGDGVAVGPGQAHTWEPVLMDASQGWVAGYSGLWGLTVQDPFEGENAPAGPMFNRDGSVRGSWADPVAFAELDLDPPPSQERAVLDERFATVEQRLEELAVAIPALERMLGGAGAEQGQAADGPGEASSTSAERLRLRHELTAMLREREESGLRLLQLRRRSEAAAAGWQPSPQAHLRRIAVPTSPDEQRTGALLELWAAISIGVLLLALVGAMVLAPELGLVAALAVIAVFVLIESVLRSTVASFLAIWVRLLAIISVVILAVTFWQLAIILLAIAFGLFVIGENLRELVAGVRSRTEPDREQGPQPPPAQERQASE
jgi:hypothetical protein